MLLFDVEGLLRKVILGSTKLRNFAEGRRLAHGIAGVALFLFLACHPLRAQDYQLQTGSPVFNTALPVELGFLDAGNGNLHLEIPIAGPPQRGALKLGYALVYDSRIWQIVAGTSSTWQPTNVPQGGWRFVTTADVGTTSYRTHYLRCGAPPDWQLYATHDTFTWTAPDGTKRYFPISTSDPMGSACSDNPTGGAYPSDSSGYSMSVSNYTQPTVYAPDGTQVYPTVEDTNGNYFSKDSNGNVIDTLGRKPVVVTTNCNGNSNQTCYDVLNSQGSTSRITVTTTTVSVSTSFGQSGVTEYSGSFTVVQSISLPDTTSYSFSYDSGTTAGHYGELTGITLPTLGQITYGYQNYQDSFGEINRWVNQRTSGGGTWSYAPVVISTCSSGQTGCQQKVAVTKPSNDNAVYTFTLNNGAWHAQEQFYNGSISSSNLLETITDTWNFSHQCVIPGCIGANYIQLQSETVTLPGANGASLNKTAQYTYLSISSPFITQAQQWKYYTGSLPSSPDRTTSITYQTIGGYITRPQSVTVTAGSTTLAQTNFSCDSTTLSSVTGIVQHDDTNFGSGNTARGNLTQTQKLVAGSTWLTTSTMYYDTTGQVTQVKDANNNSTTFSYTDNYFNDNGANPPATTSASGATNAYVTQVTAPLIGSSTMGYYLGTGKLAEYINPNGADSYTHYVNSLDRITSSFGARNTSNNRPWSLYTYNSTDTLIDAYMGITDTNASTSCSSCRHDETTLDQNGRPITASLLSDPDGTTLAQTTYDSTGRVASASNPYRSTSDPTYGIETPTYEGLDRVKKVTHQDSNYVQLLYGAAVSANGNSSQSCSSTYGLGFPTLSIDETGRKRQSWVDGFGRTIEVDEADNTGALTLYTCYSYDGLDNLTQVSQGTQTRTYAFDGLSRVTSVATPESGTTCFYYTTSGGAACSGNPGAVCRRTDARSITTTYSYDALNRLTQVSYSDGTTTTVTYSYDQGTNQKGRLTSMSDGSGQTSWTYDLLGEVLTEQRKINTGPSTSVTKTLSYAYNLDGSLASITYPSGRKVNYTIGNAGRATAVTDNNGTKYVSGASYAPTGGLSGGIYLAVSGGFNGISQSNSYNSRLEPNTVQATSANGTAINLGYSFNLGSGANNGSVASVSNNRDTGRNMTYTYDTVNRTLSATTQATSGGDCWGQSFGPSGNPAPGPATDRWSNLSQINSTRTGCSAGMLSVTVNTTTNHITTSGFGYDAAGNMTNDSSYTYSYDAENRIITASGMSGGPYCYIYDGRGLRVANAQASGGSCSNAQQVTYNTLYWRTLSGNSLAETNSSGSTQSEYVFFAGQRLNRIDANGNPYTYFTDGLGSTRTITDATGHICYDADFTPYGQEILPNNTNTCPQNYKFTGYERDSETGLDYAFARYYNPRLGRFMSPDPLGGAISDPQTLNRYAYVRNDATDLIDPSGMQQRPPGWREDNVVTFYLHDSLWGNWDVFDTLFPTEKVLVPDSSTNCKNSGDCGSGSWVAVYGNFGIWGVSSGQGGGGSQSIGSYVREAKLRLQDPDCKAFVENLLGQLKHVQPGADGASAASLASNLQNSQITLSTEPGPPSWGAFTVGNHITVYPAPQDVPETLIHESFHLRSTGNFSDIRIASFVVPTMHFNANTLASAFWDPELEKHCGPKVPQ